MGCKYFIEANSAGFYFLKKVGESGVVMPLGINIGKAVDSAREFVNLKADGSTLDEGDLLPSHLNVLIKTKQHNGKTVGDVLREDPRYLVWFYQNFDIAKNKKPENLILWKALDDLAKDKQGNFYRALSENNLNTEKKSHIGNVGDELVISVKVLHAFEVKGKFKPDPVKIVMSDDSGNKLYLIGGCKISRFLESSKSLSLPQNIQLRCKILEHGNYKGVPETKVKPIEIISKGEPRICMLLHFNHISHYSETVLTQKLSELSLISSYFVKSIQLNKVLMNVDSDSAKKDTESSKVVYRKGLAFFTVYLNALMNNVELRELTNQPLPINLDGLSLSKMETVSFMEF